MFAIELHGIVIMGRRDEQCKAVKSKQSFHGILPVSVGDLKNIAKVDDFAGAQSQFGAQDTAQAGSIGRFRFVTGFAVACAQLSDFILQPGSFGF